MRSLLALLLASPAFLTGCIGSDDADGALAPSASATDGLVGLPAPIVQTLEGVQLASALSPLAHRSATEALIGPYHREGTVITVAAAPASVMMQLDWSSPAPTTQMAVMVDIPAGEALHTIFYGFQAESPLCFVVPPEELPAGVGEWSIMIHNQNAAQVEYTFTVTSVGGDVLLQTDRYHMEVEREEMPFADDGREPIEALECPAPAA